MKYQLSIVCFLVFTASASFSQEKKTFETEYDRLMTIAKIWEETPAEIVRIKHKSSRTGRKIKIITFYTTQLKLSDDKVRILWHKRVQKTKYFKSGLIGVNTSISNNVGWGYSSFGKSKKINDIYSIVEIDTGGGKYNMSLEKSITLIKANGKNEYYMRK